MDMSSLLSSLPVHSSSTLQFSRVSHCGIMWALGFRLCFLLMLAAQVDSNGEHQGSACVFLELPDTSTHWGWGVWEETQ